MTSFYLTSLLTQKFTFIQLQVVRKGEKTEGKPDWEFSNQEKPSSQNDNLRGNKKY